MRSLLSFEEALPHCLAFEKIRSFALGLDFAPKLNGYNHGHGVADRVRDKLNSWVGSHDNAKLKILSFNYILAVITVGA